MACKHDSAIFSNTYLMYRAALRKGGNAPVLDSPLHLEFVFGHMKGRTDGQTAVEVEMVI